MGDKPAADLVQPTIINLQEGDAVLIDAPPLGTRLKYTCRASAKHGASSKLGWQYAKGGLIVRLSIDTDGSNVPAAQETGPVNLVRSDDSEREITVAPNERLNLGAFRKDAIEDGPDSDRQLSRVVLYSRRYGITPQSARSGEDELAWKEHADTTSFKVSVAQKDSLA